MNRLKNAAVKTGLNSYDSRRLFSIGIGALLSVFISFLSSCAKKTPSNNDLIPKPNTPAVGEKPVSSSDVILDTSTVLDKKSCGPTPNYPCGTRYYTVSIEDFKVKA